MLVSVLVSVLVLESVGLVRLHGSVTARLRPFEEGNDSPELPTEKVQPVLLSAHAVLQLSQEILQLSQSLVRTAGRHSSTVATQW